MVAVESSPALGPAPLHDPDALAEWNRRARAILGEPDGPTALEVWRGKRANAPEPDYPLGETDSFARRQERIRAGLVTPSRRPPRTEDGAWERSTRARSDEADDGYPDNVIPLRRQRPRIERPGGDELPSAGEAWGRKQSARRGAARASESLRLTTGRPVFRKAPDGTKTILRLVREERRLSTRQAAAACGVPRGTYTKWETAADALAWPERRLWVSRLRAYVPPERERAPTRIRYQFTCQTCGKKKWASIQRGGRGGLFTIPPPGHPRRRKHCEPCLIRTAHERRTAEGRKAERARKAAATILAYSTNPAFAEAKRARSRDYYQRNREAQQERKRADYHANKESILAYRKRLRAIQVAGTRDSTQQAAAVQTLQSATAQAVARN
jgi:transcriptional regulator with XRE-family HTH domain